jgi:hypothetical protein
MAFEKGQSGNPNGRPKGSLSKNTLELREKISQFLLDQYDTIEEDFKAATPGQRLKLYTDLLSYGIPKLQSVSNDIDIDKLTDEQVNDLWEKIQQKLNDNDTE